MAFNIFERWPWTSFQNLNLDWLLKAMKQAVTTAEGAAQTAQDAADTVAGFDSRITQANNAANSALQEANGARQEAGQAQEGAGHAQELANEAGSTAEQAMAAANRAQSAADTAQSAADTAQATATSALDDYLNVEITLWTSSPATANKNVDDILSAYSNGKKIRFFLSDVRNNTNLISYDFKIIPTIGSTDTHIIVVFEDNLTSTAYNAIVADFAKISGSHSLSVMDVTFTGSGGSAANAVLYVAQTLTSAQMAQARANIGAGTSTVSYNESTGELSISSGSGTAVAYNVKNTVIVWGYEDEDSGNAVIRRRSDNSIYTASQMAADMGARKLILIETVHGLYYLSGAATLQGVSLATFFNGGTYTMVVDGNGIYNEMPVTPVIPEITNTETTIQTTIDPNKFYVFPNAGQFTIDFNPGTSGIVNEYHFRFTSGSTATQLDIPASVIIPDDFNVAANTVYEVSIVDNYMVYSSWAVTA